MQQQPFNLKTLMEKSDSDRQREQSIYRVTIAGSIINAVLLAFKFTAGILGGSAAMIADAVRMPCEMSLYEAHEKATRIEKRLREQFGEHTHIALHLEPLKVNGCYVSPKEMNQHSRTSTQS